VLLKVGSVDRKGNGKCPICPLWESERAQSIYTKKESPIISFMKGRWSSGCQMPGGGENNVYFQLRSRGETEDPGGGKHAPEVGD